MNSNSQAMLDSCHERIEALCQKANEAGELSLAVQRSIGRELRKAKEVCPHGKFVQLMRSWDYEPSWANRLMYLDRNWEHWLAMRDALQAEGQAVDYAIDAAVRSLRRYVNALLGKEPKPRRARESADRPNREDLMRALDAAKAYINHLEETVAASTPAGADDFDARTQSVAEKVCALVYRGATAGERKAAAARLASIASRCGMSFHQIVDRCGYQM